MYCIGKNSKKIREQRNLSQYQVADKLQLDVQTIVDWELDFSQPDITQLATFALAFLL
ncbi:MAG: helix-turn-helix transcriptional regulator [Oscillospiraceae bacterium]